MIDHCRKNFFIRVQKLVKHQFVIREVLCTGVILLTSHIMLIAIEISDNSFYQTNITISKFKTKIAQ